VILSGTKVSSLSFVVARHIFIVFATLRHALYRPIRYEVVLCENAEHILSPLLFQERIRPRRPTRRPLIPLVLASTFLHGMIKTRFLDALTSGSRLRVRLRAVTKRAIYGRGVVPWLWRLERSHETDALHLSACSVHVAAAAAAAAAAALCLFPVLRRPSQELPHLFD